MLFALAPLALLLTASVNAESACTDVHLFLARGNGEDYPGRVGAMSSTVCNGLVSCDYENIMFTSTELYCSAVADGAAAGIAQMKAYANRCPKAKLVLAGYSLGAQVVGDILGGGGVSEYGCTEATSAGLDPSTSPGNRVIAAAIFGDVRHTGGQSYNTGTGSAFDGQYPRSGGQLAALNKFSSVLRSWCMSSDPICALGNDGLSHETYMTVFAAEAGTWVQDQVLGISGGGSSSSPSSSSSTPASSSTPVSSSSTPVSSTAGPTSTDDSSSTPISSTITSSSSSESSSSESATPTSTSVSSTRRSIESSFTPFSFAPTSFSSFTHSLTTTRSSTSTKSTPTITSSSSLVTSVYNFQSSTSASVLTTSSKAAGTRPTPFVAQVFRMIAQR